MDTEATPSSPQISERRLAANRANAQRSTGPKTPAGKAKSSLNAVKTGLTGHTILFADEEEADAYRSHVERVEYWWQPEGDREHTLVQALADTQWRLNAIPGLESALHALARERGVTVLTHADPLVCRLLLTAQAEIAEAKALRNLRLHERRLQRLYERHEAELETLRRERFQEEEAERRAEAKRQQEEEERQQEEAEQQRRAEQARKRAERRKAREEAVALNNGFEFSTPLIDESSGEELEPVIRQMTQ